MLKKHAENNIQSSSFFVTQYPKGKPQLRHFSRYIEKQYIIFENNTYFLNNCYTNWVRFFFVAVVKGLFCPITGREDPYVLWYLLLIMEYVPMPYRRNNYFIIHRNNVLH